MPAYPDLTVSQLQDLVAFLSSLTTGGDAACHAPAATTPGAGPPPTNVAAPLAPTPAMPLPAAAARRRDGVPGADVRRVAREARRL
jgi:hypothetical protein